ncbi:hypothetical protein JST97_36575 [bacterium]|nr:hypothetical protein [bacterium]
MSPLTSLVNVNDRIEEYRRDWQAGPGGPAVKKPAPRAARPVHLATFLMLAACSLLVGGDKLLDLWRRRLIHQTQNQANRIKTELEMSTHLRLLRQYYLSNAALPPDPMGYLIPFFKDNKPYPKGCDFWGHYYRVDSDPDQFGIRSAGVDGKMDTADDLYAGVKLKELNSVVKP